MKQSHFPPQTSKPNFTAIFDAVHTYWSENHIFEQSISTKSDDNQFRFYDGPPFVTGLPHYGHLASSVAKDVIPRFQTMKGKKVDRVRGRDCHGIPIEQKVQKKLGLESNLDIEKVGIETFINECYNYTRSTSSDWKRYIDQFARWVDFDNSYKTMDNDYMESVRRVFKTLWDKGLIYKGKRVSLYSTKLETPISNFEVAMDDTYEEVNDPAVTVMLELQIPHNSPFIKGDGATYLLVRTTTPRTIPLNIAAGVHKDIEYVRVQMQTDDIYIVARNRVEAVFANKEYTVVGDVFLGSELVGLSYKPPFDYLYGKTGNDKDHKIYHADFVSDSDGTGLVHEAPEFGDVDFQLAKKEGLTITEAMDSSGHYTSIVGDLAGVFYRDANSIVIQQLQDKGLLFAKASITHRVAFCPRSNTPLVYKAQDSWFIDINGPQEIWGGKSLKQRCIEENEKINRYPAHNKHGRFLKSLESAPDWCISRTRYWGTPMPIYKAVGLTSSPTLLLQEKGEGLHVIGSREELYILSQTGSNNIEKRDIDGKTVYRNTTRNAELDLHRPFIDDVRFERDGVRYERISEVLDCWVESASMPYAQVHYPFENKEKFEKSFPADYIVEYTGQIRAWFYVMHVLGVALFDAPAFKNVICHGVIAGNDGRKMSKSLGNFPDPKPTFAQYGGDAIRMSILTTPLFTGGDMSFSEDLIKEALKANVLPLWNAFYFFTTYANIDGFISPLLERGVGGDQKSQPTYTIAYLQEHGLVSDGFCLPYRSDNVEKAKELRKNMTLAEKKLWTGFFQKQEFRTLRQKPIHHYIVDFYIASVKLVVEIDGDSHSSAKAQEYDIYRTAMLQNYGIYVMRFTNDEVYSDFETVCMKIVEYIQSGSSPKEMGSPLAPLSKGGINLLDSRILSELSSLAQTIDADLTNYDLTHSSRQIALFLENLTNRYIRRSRRRFWKSENDGDKNDAYQTLYTVLVQFCTIASPFMPIVTEYIYRSLTAMSGSVHLQEFPIMHDGQIPHNSPFIKGDGATVIGQDFAQAQTIVCAGLAARSKRSIRVRQPLASLTLGIQLDTYFADLIADELNIKQVIYDPALNDAVTKICKPDGKAIGSLFGGNTKEIFALAKSGLFTENSDGSVLVGEWVLPAGSYELSYITNDNADNVEVHEGITMSIEWTITPDLAREGYARDLIRSIQDARKDADYDIADRIYIALTGDMSTDIIAHHGGYIAEETLSTLVDSIETPDLSKDVVLGESSVCVQLFRG